MILFGPTIDGPWHNIDKLGDVTPLPNSGEVFFVKHAWKSYFGTDAQSYYRCETAEEVKQQIAYLHKCNYGTAVITVEKRTYNDATKEFIDG